MKKTICILLAALLLAVSLSACAPNQQKLVGTWKYTSTILTVVREHQYVFNEDGTGSVPGETLKVPLSMTYTVDGDKLTIKTDVYGEQTYTYSIKKDTLTLVPTDGGETLTLQKAQ